MKRITFIILIMMTLALASCVARPTVTATPGFPIPSANVVAKIQNLHDSEVDAWMIQLAKHKQEIDAVRSAEHQADSEKAIK